MKKSSLGRSWFPAVSLAAALLSPATLLSAPRQVFDLNADWSGTENPNGVWSYNQNDTPIASFQTFWWGQAGWGYLWLGDGCVIKGSYPAGMSDPWGNPLRPAHDWQPGDVIIHGLSKPYGGETTFVNVTWTSPADGTIDIVGRAWDAEIFSDRDMSWALLVGGQIIAQRGSVQGLFRKDKGARFADNRVGHRSLTGIPVRQGDVVEFRVVATTYYGHFLGVEEQISLKPKPRLHVPPGRGPGQLRAL